VFKTLNIETFESLLCSPTLCSTVKKKNSNIVI